MPCKASRDSSAAIPTERELDLLTQIFSIFADSTRIRISLFGITHPACSRMPVVKADYIFTTGGYGAITRLRSL